MTQATDVIIVPFESFLQNHVLHTNYKVFATLEQADKLYSGWVWLIGKKKF